MPSPEQNPNTAQLRGSMPAYMITPAIELTPYGTAICALERRSRRGPTFSTRGKLHVREGRTLTITSGAAQCALRIPEMTGSAQSERGSLGYSMTSSARASSVGGTSSPRVLAVFRLITSSYLVGACTGRSAGFSPRRMRSTYSAARRYWSI
jgi:hypothetical protein